MTRTTKSVIVNIVTIAKGDENIEREVNGITEIYTPNKGEIIEFQMQFNSTSKTEIEKRARKDGFLVKWETATVVGETREMSDDIWFRYSEIVDGGVMDISNLTD